MRKIIIDDNIRNFASEYSSKVQAKCPNVITDLKKLRDNVISFNPQIDQSIVKNYINEIVLMLISDFLNTFLSLYIKFFILML